MDLGLVTSIAIGLGVWSVYGEKGKVAAVSAALTGGVLYLAYYCKLLSNPKVNEFMGIGKRKSLLNWIPLTESELKSLKVRDNIELIRRQ